MLSVSKENELLKKGFELVVGIDEVGRGCWAGNMYMVGFLFSQDTKYIEGINDSKLLSKKTREAFFPLLSQNEHIIHVTSVERIDEIGLKKAIDESLKKIIDIISARYEGKKILFLVDGKFAGNWLGNVHFIVKGDRKVYSIAAASIIAKVERDRYMCEIAKKYPNFGFERHVGYGTKIHREAIESLGLTKLHRKSFKPIKDYLSMSE